MGLANEWDTALWMAEECAASLRKLSERTHEGEGVDADRIRHQHVDKIDRALKDLRSHVRRLRIAQGREWGWKKPA